MVGHLQGVVSAFIEVVFLAHLPVELTVLVQEFFLTRSLKLPIPIAVPEILSLAAMAFAIFHGDAHVLKHVTPRSKDI